MPRRSRMMSESRFYHVMLRGNEKKGPVSWDSDGYKSSLKFWIERNKKLISFYLYIA